MMSGGEEKNDPNRQETLAAGRGLSNSQDVMPAEDVSVSRLTSESIEGFGGFGGLESKEMITKINTQASCVKMQGSDSIQQISYINVTKFTVCHIYNIFIYLFIYLLLTLYQPILILHMLQDHTNLLSTGWMIKKCI